MSPASVSLHQRPASRVSVVSVPLTPIQLMVIIESLRMARVEVLEASDRLKRVYPESINHSEQLARYAEQMAETLVYLNKVNV